MNPYLGLVAGAWLLAVSSAAPAATLDPQMSYVTA